MSVCCFLERPLLEVVYLAEALGAKAGSIFDNRQLEVERELQLIYEIGGERSPPKSEKFLTRQEFQNAAPVSLFVRRSHRKLHERPSGQPFRKAKPQKAA